MGLLRRLLVLAIWLLAYWPIHNFLSALWAPDACLDRGGSFDYRLWECSQVNQPYINTALHEVPGFWLALLSLLLAVVATKSLKRLITPRHPLPDSGQSRPGL